MDQKGKSNQLVSLMVDRFGELNGRQLLWKSTCFPFCFDEAMRQAKELVRRADEGTTVEQLLQEADNNIDRLLEGPAGRAISQLVNAN